MKWFCTGLFAGVMVGWLVTADLYGRVLVKDAFGGLGCLVVGLDAVRTSGRQEPRAYVCADLTNAVPERDILDGLIAAIREGGGA